MSLEELMAIEQQRLLQRRQNIRGYGPSRRKDTAGLFFGLERRRVHRRHKDRRELFRRMEDQPDEQPARQL
jgi:hypothetical protein